MCSTLRWLAAVLILPLVFVGGCLDNVLELGGGDLSAYCALVGCDYASLCEQTGDPFWCDRVGIPQPQEQASPDTDGDNVPDITDNCLLVPNPDQSDEDGDGAGDACDGCPADPVKTEPGTCGCGQADIDSDGDLVLDCVDNCPGAANADQADCDGDNTGDACEDVPDCNGNDIPDDCDIAQGTSDDCQPNSIPDECDLTEVFAGAGSARGEERGLLFPLDDSFSLVDFFGDGCTGFGCATGPDQQNDDDSAEIPLGFEFDLYGALLDAAFVNNNGNLSFGQLFSTFTSEGFPVSGFPMVAPFWGDVDTRGGNGSVWFKLKSNTLIVTWDQVGYFDEHGDKRNTFQVVISDGQNPVMGIGNNTCFSYDDMQWTTGDASDGEDGFGGTPATVGANAGNGVDFFQIGRFDHEGTDYDGPVGADDGVSYLDGQAICFSTSTTTSNIDPIPSGFPPGNAVTLNPSQGDVLDLELLFLSPEAGQTTTVVVVDQDGAVSAGLEVLNTPGNVAVVELNWAPDCSDVGAYILEFTATDDFSPPGVTVVTLTIEVACSLDCNNNGIPDECELQGNDCNSNGVLDDCEQDADGDEVIDGCDSCPGVPNPDCCAPGCPYSCGDLDGNMSVDLTDFQLFAGCFGMSLRRSPPMSLPPLEECVCADLNGDGEINLEDFAILVLYFGS